MSPPGRGHSTQYPGHVACSVESHPARRHSHRSGFIEDESIAGPDGVARLEAGGNCRSRVRHRHPDIETRRRQDRQPCVVQHRHELIPALAVGLGGASECGSMLGDDCCRQALEEMTHPARSDTLPTSHCVDRVRITEEGGDPEVRPDGFRHACGQRPSPASRSDGGQVDAGDRAGMIILDDGDGRRGSLTAQRRAPPRHRHPLGSERVT